jgi:hypothetical protein
VISASSPKSLNQTMLSYHSWWRPYHRDRWRPKPASSSSTPFERNSLSVAAEHRSLGTAAMCCRLRCIRRVLPQFRTRLPAFVRTRRCYCDRLSFLRWVSRFCARRSRKEALASGKGVYAIVLEYASSVAR